MYIYIYIYKNILLSISMYDGLVVRSTIAYDGLTK